MEAPLPGRSDALVSVGEIVQLMRGPDDEYYVNARLYYRPEDTPLGRNPQQGAQEVLASWRQVVLPALTLLQLAAEHPSTVSASVVSFLDFCRLSAEAKRAGRVLSPDIFFVRADFRDYYLEGRDASATVVVGPQTAILEQA